MWFMPNIYRIEILCLTFLFSFLKLNGDRKIVSEHLAQPQIVIYLWIIRKVISCLFEAFISLIFLGSNSFSSVPSPVLKSDKVAETPQPLERKKGYWEYKQREGPKALGSKELPCVSWLKLQKLNGIFFSVNAKCS